MHELFTSKKIFLVGGPGGVGKTTCAAALAISLAEKGFRTIVLTVDPAKRLAQALGLNSFSSDIQKITLPSHPNITLFATMLDTEKHFDRIIDRFAKNSEQRDRVLASPIYQTMVKSLGGSHEYAAMERLLEFAKNGDYDKIVIDTPPTQNAMELLKAPQRLANFMDNSVLKWFQGSAPKYLQVFKHGTKLAMKMLHTLFGSEFWENLGKTLGDLEGMQSGFKDRNLEVLELIRGNSSAFLLVTFPSEVRYLESVVFKTELKTFNIPLSALILNQLETFSPSENLTEDKQLNALLIYLKDLFDEQTVWVKKFEATFQEVPIFKINKLDNSVENTEHLIDVGRAL